MNINPSENIKTPELNLRIHVFIKLHCVALNPVSTLGTKDTFKEKRKICPPPLPQKLTIDLPIGLLFMQHLLNASSLPSTSQTLTIQ